MKEKQFNELKESIEQMKTMEAKSKMLEKMNAWNLHKFAEELLSTELDLSKLMEAEGYVKKEEV